MNYLLLITCSLQLIAACRIGVDFPLVLYGPEYGDSPLPKLLDGSSSLITLSISFPYFGNNEMDLYVITNGILTFRAPYLDFQPKNFDQVLPVLIAPYWADNDIRLFGNISYRTFNASEQASKLQQIISSTFSIPNFESTQVFVTTYHQVPPFNIPPNLPNATNTFQVVLVTDGDLSFVLFSYGNIQWSNGANIGFNSGNKSFMFPEALTAATVDIETTSNVGISGLYIYRVDQESIMEPTYNYTDVITSSMVNLSDSSDFLQFRFNLNGISQGGEPNTFIWRIDGVALISNISYTIADPELTSNNYPCPERIYQSRLTVTGRLPGVYTYTVNNTSTVNNIMGMFTVEAADMPSNLVLSQNGKVSIKISWTSPPNPPTQGYWITTITAITDISTGRRVSNSPFTLQSVSVGDTITISVISCSLHFNSGMLGPQSITIQDLLTPFITSSVTATSATIFLTQPINSLPADQYTVILTRKLNAQPACQNVTGTMNMTTSSESVLFESLEEFSVYSINVAVRHSLFDLTRSTESALDIITLTAAPDSPPHYLTTTSITSTSIALTWENVECIHRNGYITGFVIQYGRVGGELTIENSDTTRYSIGELLPFMEYRFQVAGINMDGTGPYTSFIGPIRTDEDVPGPVSGHLKADAKFYSMELTWSAPQMPNGVLTSYDITYRVDDICYRTDSVSANSNPQTYTLSNLEPQTNISNIIITAHTRIGTGPPTKFGNIFTTLSEPPMVENVVVTVLTNTSVRVSWDKLLLGEIIYLVLYSQTEKQATESVRVVPGTERSIDINGLITGAQYQFQVMAQYEVDEEIIGGERSSLTAMSVLDVILATHPPTTCTCNFLVAITAVVVFFSTAILCIILTLVLVACLHGRKSKVRDSCQETKEDSIHEVVQCKLENGKVTEHIYQELLSTTKTPEGVYDSI